LNIQLGAAQSALKLHSKLPALSPAHPGRRGAARANPAPPLPRHRAATGGSLVQALRRLVVGSPGAVAADAAPEHEDAEDTEEDVLDRRLSSSATSTESHSRSSSDHNLQEGWKDDDSSFGVASSSGGAPSRDITDDEQEDSDSENEALRSARVGGRRRRTRRVSVHVRAKMRR